MMSEFLLYLKCAVALFGLGVARGYWVAAGMPGDPLITQGVQLALLMALMWLFHRSYLAGKARSDAAKAAAKEAEVNGPKV